MIVIRYSLFALISTIINMLSQYIVFEMLDFEYLIYFALFIGTLTGLITKYILDKKYIFYHETQTHKENGIKFFLYSFMGVFTTIIFWGFELGFDALFESEKAKYFGGILGLMIGYVVKYNLDKKYVFTTRDFSSKGV